MLHDEHVCIRSARIPAEPAGRAVHWNFTVLTLDVTFFALGMAFMDPTAVLPLLLHRLGASDPLIGGFTALRFFFFAAFQVLVVHATHRHATRKPFLLWAATLSRLPLLAMPWLLWRAADGPGWKQSALWCTIGILGIWALGDGLGYVPWMELVARAFSERTRGRFFACTQLLSGLGSIAIASVAVRELLASPTLRYPHNYAVLALLSAAMFMISLVGVALIHEEAPSGVASQLPPLVDYLRCLPKAVRDHAAFARLAGVQLLIGFGAAASPFYVLYAVRTFHLADSWSGIYQAFHALGVVALMPLWAYLSERFGPATSVRAVAAACAVTPLLAILGARLSPWLLGGVFLLMGGSLDWGLWITLNHYLLTQVTDGDRSLYVALLNLLFVPSALYPVLGGVLAQGRLLTGFTFPPLLILVTAVTGAGVLAALRLPSSAPGEPAGV